MPRALIIVDVQPTFCEGGALPVTGGNAIAEAVAAYVDAHRDEYKLIVTTQDWHIDPGEHFSENPDFVDTWPPHGVAGTDEAELHPALANVKADVTVKKGQYKAAYSASRERPRMARRWRRRCATPASRTWTSWVWPSRTASRARLWMLSTPDSRRVSCAS